MKLDTQKEITRLKTLCKSEIENVAPNEWGRFYKSKLEEVLKILGE